MNTLVVFVFMIYFYEGFHLMKAYLSYILFDNL